MNQQQLLDKCAELMRLNDELVEKNRQLAPAPKSPVKENVKAIQFKRRIKPYSKRKQKRLRMSLKDIDKHIDALAITPEVPTKQFPTKLTTNRNCRIPPFNEYSALPNRPPKLNMSDDTLATVRAIQKEGKETNCPDYFNDTMYAFLTNVQDEE